MTCGGVPARLVRRPGRKDGHVRTARSMWFSMMLDDEPAYPLHRMFGNSSEIPEFRMCSIARSRSACDLGSGFWLRTSGRKS